MVLAVLGGFMYPLNTTDIHWVVLYEMVMFFGIAGILLLIHREGFEKETSS